MTVSADAISATASADCPTYTAQLGGSTVDQITALSADIAAWSDGATAQVITTIAASYYAAIITASDGKMNGIAAGVDATTTAASSGAYAQHMVSLNTQIASYGAYYLTTELVASNGNLVTVDQATDAVVIDDAATKYGLVTAAAFFDAGNSNELISGGTWASTWYLPKEPATAVVG